MAGSEYNPSRVRMPLLGALAIALAATCGGLALAAGAPAPAADPQARGGRPNFVVIVTDDQTAASLTGRFMPRTRKLLVKEGTNFRDFVATTPSCCPSRASMLTGTYAHNHGVLSNNIAYPGLKRPGNVLPAWLKRDGYRTGHVGKFLNGYEGTTSRPTTPGPGWSDWHTLLSYRYFDYNWSRNGRSVHYGEGPKDYLTRVINETSTQLIRRYSDLHKPWYLQVDQFAPHQSPEPSQTCPKAAKPDPRDEALFQHEPLPHPASFNEPDVSDKRRFIRKKQKVNGSELARTKAFYRCRVASLRAVDRGTRMIWKALEKTRQAKDTIVVLTSDNGFFAGEHRLGAGKTMPYAEASRVPFVVRAPRRFTGGERVRQVSELAANIDIAPTILELANAEPCTRSACRTMDGRSLVPLLSDKPGYPADREVVIEFGSDRRTERHMGTCQYSGVRRSDAIYVRYNQSGRCGPADERELYDLDADPFELDNRDGDPDYAAEQAQLQSRLDELRDCAGIAGRDDPVPSSSGFCG